MSNIQQYSSSVASIFATNAREDSEAESATYLNILPTVYGSYLSNLPEG